MRPYVGARYVPKFFDDGNGSTEWAGDTVSYEPLTIVTYLNNSYTSKKPVPVGVDISNTDYWALTGNYNAAINECITISTECLERVDAVSGELLYLDALPDDLKEYNIEPNENINTKLAGLITELGNTKVYTLRFPAETYYCGGLTIPENFILEGYGTVLIANQNTGYMLTVSNSLRGLFLKGDNAAGDVGTTATKNGVKVIGAYKNFYDVKFFGFNTALDLANDNTYLLKFVNCLFSYNELCVNGTDNANTNAGEGIGFIGCVFGSSRAALTITSTIADYSFTSCSFDYCGIFMTVARATIFLTDCHVENVISNDTRWQALQNYVFRITSSGKIFMSNTLILLYGDLNIICNSSGADADKAAFVPKNCPCYVGTSWIPSEFKKWVTSGSTSVGIFTPFYCSIMKFEVKFASSFNNLLTSNMAISSVTFDADTLTFTVNYTTDHGIYIDFNVV